MSEEKEIIDKLKVYLNGDTIYDTELDNTIQGLLDLYNIEREKNKKVNEINFRVNKNLLETSEKLEQEKEKNKKYKKSLLYMVNQFAYDEKRNKEEDEPLFTGGLGALEEAFDVLNIDEGIQRKELWNMIQELLEEEK